MSFVDRWKKDRKIVAIGDQGETPEVVLARTLEKVRAGHVSAVVVGIDWKNGEGCSTDWSRMKIKDFAYIARMVAIDADDQMRESWSEEAPDPEVAS